VTVRADRLDLGSEGELDAGPDEHVGERARHAAHVDDRGARDVEGPQRPHVRLDLAELIGVQQPHVLDPVRPPLIEERAEPRHLRGLRGDDEFPATLVGDRVLVAEALERGLSLERQSCLQRSGRVRERGMQHP
jgi:hypothetical protein